MLLLTTDPAVSQNTGFSVRPGFHAGLNFSDLEATSDPLTSKRTTFLCGVFVETNWWGRFSLQPEFQYLHKGARFDLPTGKNTIELDYLQVPVLVKIVLKPSSFIPYVFAGPNLGILLDAKSRSKTSGMDSVSAENIEDQLRKIDLSVDVGAGSEYRLADRVSFLMEIRVAFGLFDIDKTEDNRWITRDVRIIMGTKFSLK